MSVIERMRSDLERLQQRIDSRQQYYMTEGDPVIARMVGRKVELERALVVIEPMMAELERLRASVQAEKSVKETIVAQRNRAYEVNDAHLKRISLLERERDQLKAHLQRFMEVESGQVTLRVAVQAAQDATPEICLAAHDAEVIERARAYAASKACEYELAEHYDWALIEYAELLRQQAKEVTSDPDS